MDEANTVDNAAVPVEWRRSSPDEVSSPLVQQRPYLELKLEHPTLESTGAGDRFFPDAVPYELDGTPRVFYWQPSIAFSATEPEHWELVCATTHELVGFDSLPAAGPPLVTEGASGTTVVVDGTIGGDVKTSHVASYSAPAVSIDRHVDSEVQLTVNGTEYRLSSGQRRRIRLGEQHVEPLNADGRPKTITPELVARFPGQRELHHPAPGATYRLFPSFGLDLADVSNPLPVPTTVGELDDSALATALDVDLSRRPYPERALWQAFAYTAFDPHADATPELTQLPTGQIVLETDE